MYESVFGFERRYSVTKMLCDLGLPTFNTVIHNAQVRLASSVDIHNNELVKHVFHFGNLVCCYVVCLGAYYVCLSVCLSIYLFHCFCSGLVVKKRFMGHVA